MSWERDPLLSKAKLFFGYAFEFQREDHRFGLWSAMGLELLARAAISSVSPTLLAEPDPEQKHLLHALNRGSEKVPRKSISTVRVLSLCQTLIGAFKTEESTTATAMINRRNDELHSGAAAFSEFTTQQWIAGFYRCCKVLAEFLGESLESIFGKEEAAIALEVLTEVDKEVLHRVKNTIAAHNKVFEALPEDKRTFTIKLAEEEAERLAHQRHHRVKCPACSNTATVQGTAFGQEQIVYGEDEIVLEQAVSPNAFSCSVCNLKLVGYAELKAAGLGDQYTRTTTFAPDEYYGLIDPNDDAAIQKLVDDHIRDMMNEYDNE